MMLEAITRSVLDIAAEVEKAEANLKAAILDAASAGDCQAVIDIVGRWIKEPVVDVAAALVGPSLPAREFSKWADSRDTDTVTDNDNQEIAP